LFYENHSLFFINSNFYIFSCSSDAGIEEQRFINNDIYFPPLNSGIWKKSFSDLRWYENQSQPLLDFIKKYQNLYHTA